MDVRQSRFEVVMAWVLFLLFVVACFAGPFLLARIHPLLAVIGGVAAVFAWGREVPSGPGLVQGMICTNGVLILLVLSVLHLVKALK